METDCVYFVLLVCSLHDLLEVLYFSHAAKLNESFGRLLVVSPLSPRHTPVTQKLFLLTRWSWFLFLYGVEWLVVC